MLRTKTLELLYRRDFFQARSVAYALITVYAAVMMFADPFSYACSPTNPCIGCGFRAGVWLLLSGNIAEGLSSNIFVGPAVAFLVLAIIDLFVGLSRRKY